MNGHVEASGLIGQMPPQVEATVFRVAGSDSQLSPLLAGQNGEVFLEQNKGRLWGLVVDNGAGFSLVVNWDGSEVGSG